MCKRKGRYHFLRGLRGSVWEEQWCCVGRGAVFPMRSGRQGRTVVAFIACGGLVGKGVRASGVELNTGGVKGRNVKGVCRKVFGVWCFR